MQITRLTDAAAFLDRAAPALARDPVQAGVVATHAEAAAAGAHGYAAASWFVIEAEPGPAGSDVLGVAMITPPFALFVGPLDPGSAAPSAAAALVERLVGDGLTTPGVNGWRPLAEAFAAGWTAATGHAAELTMDQGVHVLTELVPPVGVPGASRSARPGDVPLLTDWLTAFHAEIVGHDPLPDPAAAMTARVAAGLVVVHEADGVPVAMAGLHPPAGGVVRIGPVYTPPQQRRRGYAAAVTAEATRVGLHRGATRAMLFTDLANPTSNGVYRRLGFRQVGQAVSLRFVADIG